MRFAGLMTLALSCSMLLNVASADAQIKVAVIDMGMVFESHPNFTSRLEALKGEILQFDQQQQQQREALVAKLKILRQQDPNSDAYRTDETDIANQTANLDVQKRLKAKEFAQKEAAIYYEVYQDVTGIVKQYCDHYQIPMVVHFNSKPMQADEPGTIMERMNSNVIYNRPDWNITHSIIEMCGGKVQPAAHQQIANPEAGTVPTRR